MHVDLEACEVFIFGSDIDVGIINGDSFRISHKSKFTSLERAFAATGNPMLTAS